MDGRPLARVAIVGFLLTVLVSMFVLNGAGWVMAEPEQRGASDEAIGSTTVEGSVVAVDPVTVEYGDGQQLVLSSADPATEIGETVEVSVAVERTAAGTSDITAQPGERLLMYIVSALAGLLVLGRALDTWRIRPRAFSVEPRDRPLHRTLLDRYRTTSDNTRSDGRKWDDAATDGGTDVTSHARTRTAKSTSREERTDG